MLSINDLWFGDIRIQYPLNYARQSWQTHASFLKAALVSSILSEWRSCDRVSRVCNVGRLLGFRNLHLEPAAVDAQTGERTTASSRRLKAQALGQPRLGSQPLNRSVRGTATATSINVTNVLVIVNCYRYACSSFDIDFELWRLVRLGAYK